MDDTKFAKELQPNGDYQPLSTNAVDEEFSVQEHFIKQTENLRKSLI
jgi:hypothetical protein